MKTTTFRFPKIVMCFGLKGAIFCFLLSLVLFGCGDRKNDDNTIRFNESSQYEISLDRFTSPVEEYIQYIPNWKGDEVIAMHVRGNNQIKLYSLIEGFLVDSIKYETEGPTAIRRVYDFHIINEDSILLNHRYHYTMSLVDQDLNVLKEFTFLPDGVELDPKTQIPTSGDTYLVVFNHNEPVRKIGNKLILTTSPDRDHYDPYYYDADYLLISLDMETMEIKRLLSFPDKMKGKTWGSSHAMVYSTYIPNSNQFIISFAADEKLHLMDLELGIIESANAKVAGFKEIRPFGIKKSNPSQEKSIEYLFNMPIYGSVLFDQYRKVYYRIGLDENPNYGSVFIRDPLHNPREITVMVFDLEFNKVVEQRIPHTENGVYLDRCFVNEKGLNIAYVDLENEDKLYFKTFLVQ